MTHQTLPDSQGPRDLPIIFFASCPCAEGKSSPRLSRELARWQKSCLSASGSCRLGVPESPSSAGRRVIKASVIICQRDSIAVKVVNGAIAVAGGCSGTVPPLSAGEAGLLIPNGTTVPEESLTPTCRSRHTWPVPVLPLPGKLPLVLRTAPCRLTPQRPTRSWHRPGGAGPFGSSLFALGTWQPAFRCKMLVALCSARSLGKKNACRRGAERPRPACCARA